MDDVLLNKAAIIDRCWRRIAEEYGTDAARLSDLTHQDAIILSLERACQAAIDAAMHVVARDRLAPDLLHPDNLQCQEQTRQHMEVVEFRLQMLGSHARRFRKDSSLRKGSSSQ